MTSEMMLRNEDKLLEVKRILMESSMSRALEWISQRGFIEGLKYLCEQNCENCFFIEYDNENNSTDALRVGIIYNQLEYVKYIIDNRLMESYPYLLVICSERNNFEIFKYLAS